MENEQTQTTLRDTIAAQVEALENASTDSADTASTAAPAPSPAPSHEDAVAQTAGDDKPGRTAGRLRDDQGRLLPGKAEAAPAEVPLQVAEAAKPGAVASPPVVTPAAEQSIPCPVSWKLEMKPEFDKLPPNVKAYVAQREAEVARGFTPLKQEVERAKPVMDAIAPHLPLLQQHGIDPGQQVGRYMQIHKTMAMGSPQEKLGLFAQLAKDYQIPLEQMFVRAQDGQVYLNTNLQYTPPAPPQADVNTIIETKMMEREVQQATRQFIEGKDASGNPLHPHFETVRETMSQLLAGGAASDLQSAYDASLRLPQHSHLYDAQQQQLAAADEAKKAKELADRAAVARRSAVSVRSASPASSGGGTAPKGIRGSLESAWDQHMPGRV